MLKQVIKRYPIQTVLILFNTGIFAYLQQMSHHLSQMSGIEQLDVSAYLPNGLSNIQGHTFPSVIDQSAWTWLLLSIIFTVISRFVKGLLKLLLFITIIICGLWLFWHYQDTVNALLSAVK